MVTKQDHTLGLIEMHGQHSGWEIAPSAFSLEYHRGSRSQFDYKMSEKEREVANSQTA